MICITPASRMVPHFVFAHPLPPALLLPSVAPHAPPPVSPLPQVVMEQFDALKEVSDGRLSASGQVRPLC